MSPVPCLYIGYYSWCLPLLASKRNCHGAINLESKGPSYLESYDEMEVKIFLNHSNNNLKTKESGMLMSLFSPNTE